MSQKAPTTQTYLTIAGGTIPAWRYLLEQEYTRTLKSLTTLQGGTPLPTAGDMPPLAEIGQQTPAPEVAITTPAPSLEELRTAVQDFGGESPSESISDEAESPENEQDPAESEPSDTADGEATAEMPAESDKYFDTRED